MVEKNYVGDLLIIRGMPNSGKKTLAKVILQTPNNSDFEIISIDGDNKQNIASVNECHIKCAERMRQEISRIVVTGTFQKVSDLNGFYEMAERYNYRVHSIIVETRHEKKSNNNIDINGFEIKLI